MIRRFLMVLVLLASACTGSDERAAGADSPPDLSAPEPAEPGLGCAQDSDCALAASACCECPSFAVLGAQNDATCDISGCGEPAQCAAVEPACELGQCVLACQAVACDLSCEAGYVREASGCLTCQCAAPVEPECVVDGDCVQVQADCCGCASGGVDTAVPNSAASSFVDSLGCDEGGVCPDVDVCDPQAVALCIQGSCRLINEPDSENSLDDARRCGSSDYPECPNGAACVLNGRDDDGQALGLGLCQIPE